MKSSIKASFELVLGILFIVMAVLGYYKDVSHMFEYCFLSGLSVGIVMLICDIDASTGRADGVIFSKESVSDR